MLTNNEDIYDTDVKYYSNKQLKEAEYRLSIQMSKVKPESDEYSRLYWDYFEVNCEFMSRGLTTDSSF